MTLVETEHVLVAPTQVFREVGYVQGFTGEADQYLDALLAPGVAQFLPRDAMEQDPSYKQLIPYVMFRYLDDNGRENLFQYVRGDGQGESRLHRKRSLGVGGHISSEDSAEADRAAYERGMQREIEEEVEIDTAFASRCVGLINDDRTEVGQVHLGVVHLFDVQQPHVRSREEDILEAGFVPVLELLADTEGMESWSKICLEALFGKRRLAPEP